MRNYNNNVSYGVKNSNSTTELDMKSPVQLRTLAKKQEITKFQFDVEEELNIYGRPTGVKSPKYNIWSAQIDPILDRPVEAMYIIDADITGRLENNGVMLRRFVGKPFAQLQKKFDEITSKGYEVFITPKISNKTGGVYYLVTGATKALEMRIRYFKTLKGGAIMFSDTDIEKMMKGEAPESLKQLEHQVRLSKSIA